MEKQRMPPKLTQDNSPSKKTNILKVQYDREYVFLERSKNAEHSTEEPQFQQCEGYSAKWITSGTCSISDIRNRVEPWLTSLFQSEHLSLLVGNGLSMAIETLAGRRPTNAMAVPTLETEYADNIKSDSKSIAEKNGRGDSNIEDYIRVINEGA
jgi:hypothetical protein